MGVQYSTTPLVLRMPSISTSTRNSFIWEGIEHPSFPFETSQYMNNNTPTSSCYMKLNLTDRETLLPTFKAHKLN